MPPRQRARTRSKRRRKTRRRAREGKHEGVPFSFDPRSANSAHSRASGNPAHRIQLHGNLLWVPAFAGTSGFLARRGPVSFLFAALSANSAHSRASGNSAHHIQLHGNLFWVPAFAGTRGFPSQARTRSAARRNDKTGGRMTVLRFGLTPKMKPVSPRRSAVVAALDVGTSKVVCLIAKLEPVAPQDVLRRRRNGE